MANKNKEILAKQKVTATEKAKASKSPVTVEQMPDGTFKFHGGKGGLNIVERKNAALAPYGKCLYNYGVVLELIPEDKRSAINQQIGNARFVHNDYLSERIKCYNEKKETLTYAKYKKEYLPALKDEYEFLKESDKFALDNAGRNVDNAYGRFFKGLGGFPKYASCRKPNGNNYTTNFTNNNIGINIIDGLPYIKLPKIGQVRFILPKGKTLADIHPYGTSIKAVTISKSNNRYYAALKMEGVIDKPVFPTVIRKNEILAADLGIKYFGVFGNMKESTPVENPRWIKLHAKRLRRFQQSLSRKQYDLKTHTGSKNWEKARIKVAKEQRKTADQRKDFHHKLARAIADNYSVFVCEDLAVKNMMKNRHLSKAIASAGWSQFLTFVKYKMERAGKYFLKVDRCFPSSQKCTCCGFKNVDVKKLTVREWTCPVCGVWHDRDINAQQNIFKEGIKGLQNMGIQVIA